MSTRHNGVGSLAALLLLALAVFLPTASAAEEWRSIPPNPDIDVVYGPAGPEFEGIRQKLIEFQLLERLQRFFSPLRLPHHLQLRTDKCGQVNAFYKPYARSITLCYEIVAMTFARAPSVVSPDGMVTRDAAIFGGIAGILLHESGHMMFDMFDVPRFGREEDAADELAAFLTLQASEKLCRSVINGFGIFMASIMPGAEGSSSLSAWSDVHGSGSQRLYNTLCLAYGGKPEAFKSFVDRGWLPQSRAVGCAAEYTAVKQAFAQTIYPFMDPTLLARVEAVQWFPSR